MLMLVSSSKFTSGRSPRGERGLKLLRVPLKAVSHMSLPPREAWIEIYVEMKCARPMRRSPRGERGLKWLSLCRSVASLTVAPPAGNVD